MVPIAQWPTHAVLYSALTHQDLRQPHLVQTKPMGGRTDSKSWIQDLGMSDAPGMLWVID